MIAWLNEYEHIIREGKKVKVVFDCAGRKIRAKVEEYIVTIEDA